MKRSPRLRRAAALVAICAVAAACVGVWAWGAYAALRFVAAPMEPLA